MLLFVFRLIYSAKATSGPLRDCEGFSAAKCSPDPAIILDGPIPFSTENENSISDTYFFSLSPAEKKRHF